MNSLDIIKEINQIYDRFFIPPNLREHMLRAASVGAQICDHWQGPEINHNDIIAVLLIHDLGNIVKMDLESKIGLKLIGKEQERVNYWKKIKKTIIEKYGSDDHIVSEKMVQELRASERLQLILKNKVFNNNEFTLKTEDWEIKIAAYADQRIGPFGVLSLKERFRELKERYAQRDNKNVNNPKIDIFIDCAFKIERQIFQHININPEEINDQSITSYFKTFQQKD